MTTKDLMATVTVGRHVLFSDVANHTAYLGKWAVSWLPERQFDIAQAKTALEIATTLAAYYDAVVDEPDLSDLGQSSEQLGLTKRAAAILVFKECLWADTDLGLAL